MMQNRSRNMRQAHKSGQKLFKTGDKGEVMDPQGLFTETNFWKVSKTSNITLTDPHFNPLTSARKLRKT